MGPRKLPPPERPRGSADGFRQPGKGMREMVQNAIQSRREFVAFHGDPARKAFYLERLRNHVRKDEIDPRSGRVERWQGGRDRLHRPQQRSLSVRARPRHPDGSCLTRGDHLRAAARGGSQAILSRISRGRPCRGGPFVRLARHRSLAADRSRVRDHSIRADAETRAAILLVADLYARVLRREPVSPQRFRDAVQIAGPLGEGVAAQVVSGAAEAVFDTIQITAWTVGQGLLWLRPSRCGRRSRPSCSTSCAAPERIAPLPRRASCAWPRQVRPDLHRLRDFSALRQLPDPR